MKKMMLASFLLVLSGAAWADTPDLGREKVEKIWPYPEKIIKVVSAKGVIESEGRTLRLSDVVTKSSISKTCQTHRTQFHLSASGWQFDSIQLTTPVSCKTFKSKGPSTDPRYYSEKAVNETNKTAGHIRNVITTGLTIKSMVGL